MDGGQEAVNQKLPSCKSEINQKRTSATCTPRTAQLAPRAFRHPAAPVSAAALKSLAKARRFTSRCASTDSEACLRARGASRVALTPHHLADVSQEATVPSPRRATVEVLAAQPASFTNSVHISCRGAAAAAIAPPSTLSAGPHSSATPTRPDACGPTACFHCWPMVRVALREKSRCCRYWASPCL